MAIGPGWTVDVGDPTVTEVGEVPDRRGDTSVVGRPHDGHALRRQSASHDHDGGMRGERLQLAPGERRAEQDEGLAPLVHQAECSLSLVTYAGQR